ncbi:UDP-galactose/UDP-glucose transporter 7-like [Glycine soja]|uniref:UDP-galactose/UDP-glucose transporter 7 n=1 Tax=Glycine max TaxID=3847 RepID=UPI0003DEA4DF|nr:UDP-galactose/UDP-glucose transporter 7 [Glycine max]XP_028228141.1 UDP-galactose/UDP-glucose transporter 7-like [Glycine soja]|eukprot:XP_006578205.1 UDP-galactose/UDP-glucose transporter 7 [Glycine max]
MWVALSVILTAAGVLIAALGDFFSWPLFPFFFQTMYLVLVEKSGAEDGLSSLEIMFYNSFLSLPFFMFLIIATGELPNSLSVLFAKTLVFFLLGGVQVHALNVSGLVINTAGGVWYSFAKYQKRKSKAVKLVTEAEAHCK